MAKQKKHLTVRNQARIPGVRRIPVSSGLIPALELCIRHDMARFNVSRSFALAAAAARGYGLTEQEQFDDNVDKIMLRRYGFKVVGGRK